MVITILAFAFLASTWIICWHLGTQAAIAGAIVMTLAFAGVLSIYCILKRIKDR